ncbi:MAG: hypothetical protein JO299_00530 [Gammaproteobacteria bacterium]|nr:hypothetical protein [Gammaproteobacteria bacterium]
MPRPAAARCLSRARRYQRWHEHPRIARRTSFFAAAAIVNRALARHALSSQFLLELGATLERVNTLRALEILAGRRYQEGSVESNTLDFIRFEQAVVQAHLDGLRRSSERTYRREIRAINSLLGALRYGVIRALANRCFVCAADETLRCLGGPLDFAEQHCRVTLGVQIAYHATLLPAPRQNAPHRQRGWSLQT